MVCVSVCKHVHCPPKALVAKNSWMGRSEECWLLVWPGKKSRRVWYLNWVQKHVRIRLSRAGEMAQWLKLLLPSLMTWVQSLGPRRRYWFLQALHWLHNMFIPTLQTCTYKRNKSNVNKPNPLARRWIERGSVTGNTLRTLNCLLKDVFVPWKGIPSPSYPRKGFW